MEPKKPNKARFADPAAHIPYYMHRFAPSRVTSSYSYVNAEAQTYVAAMAVAPDDTRKGVIDTFFTAIKASPGLAAFDAIWLLAAHTEQAALLNAVTPGTKDLTASGSYTFTADQGFTGNGTDAFLNTGTAHSGFTKFTQDNAHAGVWARTAGTAGRNLMSTTSTTLRFDLKNNAGATERAVRMNAASSTTTNDNLTVGHIVGVRPDAANQLSYRDGTSETTAAVASAALQAENVVLLRTGSTYSDAQILAAHIGSKLTALEVDAVYDALNAYKTSVGA
jgi:hypothetical protein